MKYCLKKHLLSLLLVLGLVFILPAQAAEIDLAAYARSNLTEVLGFTSEEANEFILGEPEDDSISFWHPDHPEWVYTLSVSWQTGRISGTTPFDTGYTLFRGENVIRQVFRTVRDEKILENWDQDRHQDLLSLLDKNNIRISTGLYFAESAGNAVHGLYESCYGPEFGWPEPLHQLYQDMMDEYHLVREQEPFHQPGVRRIAHTQASGSVRTITLFEKEIPEDLKSILTDPRLDGWQCTSGAVVCLDWPSDEGPQMDRRSGLAAFEKDGRRQLMQLYLVEGEWILTPLGENALYQSGDYRVTYDGIHASLAVEYPLSEHEQVSFFLLPRADKTGFSECAVTAYERLDDSTGEAVWLNVYASGNPTWERELDTMQSVSNARFPYSLGLVPLEMFPATAEEAAQNVYVFPDQPYEYALVYGANFRTGTSSHSHSYGELKPGVIIPVLDIVPGDPYEWIHTRLGSLEGYVVISYTSLENMVSGLSSMQPVAEAKKEISLKRGTGWFDGSVGTFPAGTRMHVVFESGDWLYVDIPSGEISWPMDPSGTFGYVHKNDVVQASSVTQLDWMNQ